MPEALRVLLVMLFPLGVVAAGLKDATSYIIPNRLNAAIALAFIPAAFCAGLSGPVFGVCVLAGFVALLLGVGLFCLRIVGGGDAKLLAASVLWLGPAASAPFLAWTAVAGGALAVGLLAARRTPALAGVTGPAWVQRLLDPKGDAPYGVAIAIGALVAFPASPIVRALHGL